MSRVRNADEFSIQIRNARRDYDQRYKPRLDGIRKKYAENPSGRVSPDIDESLEAHLGVYLINVLLGALNWRLDCGPGDGLPNLVPEVPVSSVASGRRRFLDYLGLEGDTDKPLLVVETKRPRARLPQRTTQRPKAEYASAAEHLLLTIRDGLAGADLAGEWNKWLDDLRDYVRSVHVRTDSAPQRVVITNGNWLILLLDAPGTFLANKVDPDPVLVWHDWEDIQQRSLDLFRQLDYFSISKDVPFLTVGELPFYVGDSAAIDRAMHGLRLLYIEQASLYGGQRPVIQVAPVLLLHSRYGSWLRVERPSEHQVVELPHNHDDLPYHLDTVRASAESLLHDVNLNLGTALIASPVTEHYWDHDSFDDLLGVKEVGYRSESNSTEYLVVTGTNTHFLLPTPSPPICACPYHDWSGCQKQGMENNPGPVVTRSVRDPRSFFLSGESHHCAHCDVANAKASQIPSDNLGWCGPRSGQIRQAFCEIWRFEQHLCCRACAFEEVCTAVSAFRLPCQNPRNVSELGSVIVCECRQAKTVLGSQSHEYCSKRAGK